MYDDTFKAIRDRRKQDRLDKALQLPKKDSVYLECYGPEKLYSRGSHATKYCCGCNRVKTLSYFLSEQKGLYRSVLCKGCLKFDNNTYYEYQISSSKVYRSLVNKLRYTINDSSLDCDDISEELSLLYKNTIILKTKINGKIKNNSKGD